MKRITKLDYEILKRIPLYPKEKSRSQILVEIKTAFPDGRYNRLTTAGFDANLLKYTKMFMLAEDKDIPDNLFFEDMYDDADCLQSTMKPINLEWVKQNIGQFLDSDEDEIYQELIGAVHHGTRDGWYRQSKYHLG